MAIDPVAAVRIHRGLRDTLEKARVAGPGTPDHDELERIIVQIVEIAYPEKMPVTFKDETSAISIGEALLEASTDLVKKLAANN